MSKIDIKQQPQVIWTRTFRYFVPVISSLVFTLLFSTVVFAEDGEKEATFFNTDVLPILKKRCYDCHSHSSGTMKGGLALDWKSGWLNGGESGPSIVPGKPEESLLIEAVRRESFEMPPDETLAPAEIATLVKWVEQGAHDPRTVEPAQERPSTDWWSLRPLQRPDVPDFQVDMNPVDAFINAKLHQEGLKQSAQADRRTLLRRLSFDLHGLPPTPEQVAAFVNDSRPDAYDQLVDSLLTSPRYGERWARHWLDVIHFAETHGFEHDVFRPHAWRFRDYVVKSFNEDTPWQDFVREQLAADVFFPEESHLIAALGFLGAGPFDLSTASTAPVTFDYMDRDDLVTQTMAAFVSTTANCARCHAHKFDPITQADYYSLQAVFAGVGKGDRDFDADPEIHKLRLHWQELLDAANTNNAEVLLAQENESRIANWIEQRSTEPVEWDDLSIEIFLSSDGAELERLKDGSVRAGGTRPDVDTYTLTATTDLAAITAIRLDVLADDALPMQGPGRQDNGNLHLTEVEVYLFNPGAKKSQRLGIAQATADFDQAGWTIAHALDENLKTAWGIHPEVGKSHHAVFELAETVHLQAGAMLVVMLKQLHGAGHLIGRCKLSATAAPVAQVSAMPTIVTKALSIPKADRTDVQHLAIASHAARLISTAELAKLPEPVQVYAAAATYQRGKKTPASIPPKVVHVLARGDIQRPEEVAVSGALSGVESLPSRFELADPQNEATRRAALADWIASPDNPLTWRSIANRVWQFHFGQGLCETPSDFGRMGGLPSHPELLDWLACELRENGGSLKHLHRLILSSDTYKQSSASRAEALLIDSENRLLWRVNRSRLDAESFHDAVLQISGRIDLKMDGPGVQHFTLSPGQQVTPQVHYDQFDWTKPESARRAIYRVVWRGIPDPMYAALDFPDLGLLAPQRSFSVSALQSLAIWNHPFILHHCEVTAKKLAEQASALDDQISVMFQTILLRDPSAEELQDFTEYSEEFGLAAGVRLLLNSNEFLFVD